jgi:histone H3/H4
MEENNIKANTLIKRRNLILELKKAGIKRANKEAVLLLEKYLEKNLFGIIEALNEEMTPKGRKTLKKEDVEKIFTKNKEIETWEI